MSEIDQIADNLGRIIHSEFFLEKSTIPSHEGCDEVYPNIYLGDGLTAKDKAFLKHLGITHVLNAAMGSTLGMVDTNAKFYEDVNISFKGFHMADLPGTNLKLYFNAAADFIDKALSSNGKVFVHCLMGISRSTSCVMAYLMLKQNLTAEEALKQIRSRRWVAPNTGFLKQLAELDFDLRQKRKL